MKNLEANDDLSGIGFVICAVTEFGGIVHGCSI